ncbi:MAG: pyridoxal phosphate-dependent aminotransferase family protein, partial [Candidatus Nitrosotenuis sp.]
MKLDYIAHGLAELRKQNLYRNLRDVKVSGPHITIGKKRLANFCSNDYLGLANWKIKATQLQS